MMGAVRAWVVVILLGGCVNRGTREPLLQGIVQWRPDSVVRGPGIFESPVFEVEEFDRAVVSWNGAGEFGVELTVRTLEWQPWASVGRWGARPEGAKSASGEVSVDVDTLSVRWPANAFRVRISIAAPSEISLVSVAYWKSGWRRRFSSVPSAAWGRLLPVSERSQKTEDPSVSGRLCSPTSVAMVLDFYGIHVKTREVADGVYDHASDVYGNWAFNVAHVHRLSGGKLEAAVARGGGLEDVESEIAAGRPVVLSHRWSPGELDGAPVESSDGHLVVVVGFTKEGDAIVNDPAGAPGQVRRVYRRAQIHHTWLMRGSGVFYRVKPR